MSFYDFDSCWFAIQNEQNGFASPISIVMAQQKLL